MEPEEPGRARWLTLGSLVIKLVVLLQLLHHAGLHVLQLAQAVLLQKSGTDMQYLLWRVTTAANAVTAPLATSCSSLAPAGSCGTWLPAHPGCLLLALAAAAWLAAEATFHVLWFRPRLAAWNSLRSSMACPAGLTSAESAALFARFIRACRESRCEQDFLEDYLSTWFRGAPLQSIHRENMEELFAYGFYYKSRAQMQAAGLGHLPPKMAAEFEAVFGLSLAPGYNPALSFMSHLWEDLRVHPRPLAFYVMTEGVALLAAGVMWGLGFVRQQHGALRYYTRNLPSPDSTTKQQQQQQQVQPVVFMHGVAGLVLYLPLVARLAASGAPLVVLDLRHVGLRLCRSIPGIDSLTDSLAAVLKQLNLPPATVMAHSYGTLLASRLLRLHRAAVARLVLVDPVCLGMFMPRLLHGFLYAGFSLRTLDLRRPLAAAQQLMLWLVAKDVHLAATFARGFYWSDLNLWPEELPAGSCVVLGGADALVQASEVADMLQLGNPSIKVLLKPDLIHGGFMLHHATRSAVLAEATAAVAAAAMVAAAGTTAAAAAAGDALAAAAEGAHDLAGAAAEAVGATLASAGDAVGEAASAAADVAALAAKQLTHAATSAAAADVSDTCGPADQGQHLVAPIALAGSKGGSPASACKHGRSMSACSALELDVADDAACDALCKPLPAAAPAVRGSFATWHHAASDSASSFLDDVSFAATFNCASWSGGTAAATVAAAAVAAADIAAVAAATRPAAALFGLAAQQTSRTATCTTSC